MLAQTKNQAKGQILDSGQNLITLKGIEHYLLRFFESELNELEKNWKRGGAFVIVGLEQKLERNITLPQKKLEIKILGYADRIEKWNGIYRVIDYKTGYVKEGSLNKIQFDNLFEDVKNEKAIQLLSYAWLLQERFPKDQIQSGIIALRNVNNPYVFIGNSAEEPLADEDLKIFENNLKEFFNELFDEKIPFEQTSEKENCQYCPYVNICLK